MSVHIPMRCSPLNTSVYSSSFRCTSVSNPFSIFRTVASIDACQSAVTASPLPSTESTHRRTFFIHALCVVKQYAIVLAITPNRYLLRYTLVSKVSSGRGETQSSVGKNHNTRISLSMRVTADNKCPSNISSGSLRACYFSQITLENHTDRVFDRARNSRDFSTVCV